MMNSGYWKIYLVAISLLVGLEANAQTIDTLVLEDDIRMLQESTNFEKIKKDLSILVKQQPSTALRLSRIGLKEAIAPNEHLTFLNTIVFALLTQADYKQAEVLLKEAESLANEQQLHEYLPTIYLYWGNLYWRNQDIEAGLKAADRCANVAEQLNDSLHIAKSKVLKGWLLRRQGDNEAAFTNFKIALEYFERTNNEIEAASALNGMASTAFILDNLSDAAEYWIKSSVFAAKNGLLNLEQSVSSNLGFLYLRMQEFHKSRTAFFQSLSLAEQTGDLAGKAHVCYNLTEFYQYRNQPDSTRIFGQMTLDIGAQIGDYIRMSGAHMSLADLDIADNQLATAEMHTQEAIRLAEISGDIYTKGYSFFQWGQIKTKLGAFQLALNHYKKALMFFEQTGEMSWQGRTIKEMATIYEQLNQPKLALDFFKRNSTIQDSLKEREHVQKILAIEKQFNLEKKEEEIAHLAQQNDLLTANEQKNRYIIVALIISLLLVGLVFILAYRQRKLRLEKGLAEVKQKLLRQQMNPHFIFNTLNSVQNQFLKGDIENSVLLMGKYSKLMRLVLSNSNETFVSIYDELELLRLYLDLEQLRTNSKFEYIINIGEDIDIYNISLPSMITQIFVENAIWHGIAHKSERGIISLNIARLYDNIIFSIEDDGVGRKYSLRTRTEPQKEYRSLGTQLVKSRIQQINRKFAQNIRLRIEDLQSLDGSAKGTRVNLIFDGRQ